jgi:hypothetical protein
MAVVDHSLHRVATSPSRRGEAQEMGLLGVVSPQTISQCLRETLHQATSRMDKGLETGRTNLVGPPMAVNHPLLMVAGVRLDRFRLLQTDQLAVPAEVGLAIR